MFLFCLSLLTLFVSFGTALNAPKPTEPNPNTCFRTVGYWGQNSVGLRFPREQWERPIEEYCQDDTWDIFIVSFMHIFYNGNPPLPGLNFAYHCESAPFPGYPFLLQCPAIGSGIRTCQEKGKIVLLSMGGAASNGQLASEQAGIDFADTLWHMFLGGGDPDLPRPFDDVSFDGIDLDIEGGSPVGYGSFVNRLREWYDTDPNKTYYIGGAPQCPFPDAYLGPTGSYNAYALGVSWFDFVFIQFYNNFCGIQNYPSFFNFEDWNNWAKEAKTQVFLGVPGASYSGGGYQNVERVKEIAGDMIEAYGPQNSGWFGGVMTWDVGSAAQNIVDGVHFMEDIAQFLKEHSPNNACAAVSAPPPPISSSISSAISSSMASFSPSVVASAASSSSEMVSSSISVTASSSSVLPVPSPPSSPPPPSSGCTYVGSPSSGPGGIWRDIPVPGSPNPVKSFSSTVHLGPVLTLDVSKLDEQIQEILSSSKYEDSSLWSANTQSDDDYVCPLFSPIDTYSMNPTQMLIAKPSVGSFVTISNTNINIRLLDKWFGMFLAYALDDYGLNPHALLALAAKETFSTAASPNGDDGRDFLAADVSKGYDLYGTHFGYGTDGNRDGPFQVEKFTAATAFSIFPSRFNFTDSQDRPSYELDTAIAAMPQLDDTHAYWVTNMYRAVVLTALDFHWRYNALLMVPGFGMRVPWERRDEEGKDEIVFASTIYAYNRGVYGSLVGNTCGCPDNADPISGCGLNGFGGHGQDIKDVCQLLDQATEVYDYPISWDETEAFIAVLKSTFPYSQNGADNLHDPIDWEVIKNSAESAFNTISQNRASKGGVSGSSSQTPEISFKYDWRLLLAVIRAYLPPREEMVGITWFEMVQFSFGSTVATDPGYKFDSGDLMFSFQSEAGGRQGDVQAQAPASATQSPTSSSGSPPASSISVSMTSMETSSASSSPTMSSSSVIPSAPSVGADSTPLPACICSAEDGFVDTRAPGYSIKPCSNGEGVLMNVCSLLPNGNCRWGVAKSFCVTGSAD